MLNWIFSTVIPILIILIALFVYRPLNFQRIVKALTKTLMPLFTYSLLMYYLETEDYINTSWVTYTVFMLFIPYLVVVLVLNGVVWTRRKKA